MCGRYTSITPADAIARYFGVDEVVSDDLGARYNVAPTDEVYAVARHGVTTRLGSLRWGLLPHWASHRREGAKMINARAESLTSKPPFREAFARRRCLIPADGFYEWQHPPGTTTRTPWYIRPRDGRPLALAGLWASWRPRGDEPGERVVSAAIVTTSANETVAGLHDRMPVVLAPQSWDAWLDPDNDDVDGLQRLLVPAPAEHFELIQVRPLVNQVANDGAELIEPADEATPAGRRA